MYKNKSTTPMVALYEFETLHRSCVQYRILLVGSLKKNILEIK